MFVFSKLHRSLIFHISAVRILHAHKKRKAAEAAAFRGLKFSGAYEYVYHFINKLSRKMRVMSIGARKGDHLPERSANKTEAQLTVVEPLIGVRPFDVTVTVCSPVVLNSTENL